MPKLTSSAPVTDLAVRYHVVGGTDQFQVIDVIKNGDTLTMELPQNRRREVVVDVANMCHVGPKLRDGPPQPSLHVDGINRMPGKSNFFPRATRFEVDEGCAKLGYGFS